MLIYYIVQIGIYYGLESQDQKQLKVFQNTNKNKPLSLDYATRTKR